jgi:hypothetical protein
MTPNPHPQCPICRLIDAAQGQPIKTALNCLKLAEQHQCGCRGKKHKVLLKHPHTVDGCRGFQAPAALVIERVINEEG